MSHDVTAMDVTALDGSAMDIIAMDVTAMDVIAMVDDIAMGVTAVEFHCSDCHNCSQH